MKRKNKKQVIVWFGVGLFLAVFCACGDGEKKPAAPQPPVKPQAVQTAPSAQPKAVQAAPAPAASPALQQPALVYSYRPQGKPDPFRPFVDAQIAAASKARAATRKESIFPLQKAGVENFKIVGIMGDEARRMAIVEDAAKKFYPLFVGTRVGLRNGKVADILADRVIVEELEGKKTRRVVLKLRQNQ